MSGLIQKAKDVLHSDKKDNAATDNPRSTNAGPHGSNAMNSADPRVDSDRDNFGPTGGMGQTGTHGSSGLGSTTHGSTGVGHTGTHGTTGTGASGLSSGTGAGFGGATTGHAGGPGNPNSSNAGPHSSNMANKADPRVDSNLDGSRTMGGNQTGAGYGSTTTGSGIGGTTGSGIGGTHSGYGGPGNPQSGNAGPHSSNMANSADPRVDSDMDGGRHAGLGTSGVGHTSHTGHTTGTHGHGTTGTHNTGLTGSSATAGSGNASKTAGPHNSDMMNKLDPRVDSDRDGSKTVGGNKTFQ